MVGAVPGLIRSRFFLVFFTSGVGLLRELDRVGGSSDCSLSSWGHHMHFVARTRGQIPRQKAYFENGSPEAEPAVCRKKQTCPVTNSTPTWRLRYLARHIPAALPARHRSLQPAKPAKVGILPRKKMSRLSSKPTTSVKNFSSCPVGGQLYKVSANLPGKAAPARRHGGTQLMSRTNYEAVADFAGHWLHRAQVSLLTGKIGQLSHIRKKNPGAGLVRAWCGPGGAWKKPHRPVFFFKRCIISPLEGRLRRSGGRRSSTPGRRDSVLSLACTLQDDVRKELAVKARLLQSGLMRFACT